MTDFFSVRESGEEIQNGAVPTFYRAAFLWNADRQSCKVFQIVPPDGAIVRQIHPSELLDVIRLQKPKSS